MNDCAAVADRDLVVRLGDDRQAGRRKREGEDRRSGCFGRACGPFEKRLTAFAANSSTEWEVGYLAPVGLRHEVSDGSLAVAVSRSDSAAMPRSWLTASGLVVVSAGARASLDQRETSGQASATEPT